jgi:molybdopterin molybdotransferase
MISVEEASARVLAGVQPLPAEIVSVDRALGRVLAEDLAARRTQPPAAVSAMDGYAVRSADLAETPATLRRVGYVPAGRAFERAIGPGECVRLFTGAPLPGGADTVVVQEDVSAAGDRVRIDRAPPAGRHVRPAGLDFTEGAVMLKAGRRLTARDVGLAAAMDRPWLAVRRRPRVAVLATGDEIALPGDPLGPNRIVSANSFALAALVEAEGGVPVNLGIARDDRAALSAMAAGAAGADLLLTSGGASVGDHDLVRAMLGEAGAALDFWKIAMRPGKPLIHGRIGAVPVLGLPGNPVSAVVCAALFARPILRALQGLTPTEPPLAARLGRDLPANDRRQDYLRCRIDRDAAGAPVASPFELQDSSALSVLAAADGLLVRPPHAPPAPAGSPVEVVPLAGGGAPIQLFDG